MNYLLDRAMIVLIPRSGIYVCSAQSAEKSPIVHPMRHRNVLMPALFHVPRQVQKTRSDDDSLGFSEAELLHDISSFFEACIWRGFEVEGNIFEVTRGRGRQVVR